MAAAILVSLFVAVTLTPMLASRVLPPVAPGHVPGRLERLAQALMEPLERRYAAAVDWSSRHRVVVVVALVLVAASVPLFRATPADLLPEDDQSEFEISVELPTGTPFAAADDVIAEIEAQLARLPGVNDVLVTVGDARGTGSATPANLYVGLLPIGEREFTQGDVMNRARAIFSRYPDLRETVGSLNTAGVGGGGYGSKLRLAVHGPDIGKLEEILKALVKEMRAAPAFVDVFSPSADRLPELPVIPDRKKAAEVGITPLEIAESLRVLVGGDRVSSFKEGDERDDIVLRARLRDRASTEAIGRLPLSARGGHGGTVTVASLARVEEAVGPTLILRLDGLRQVFVSSQPVPGVPLGTAVEHAHAIVDRLNLPPGYDTVFLGDVKTQEETRAEVLLALLLSLVFVCIFLAAQFESLLRPITILLAVPRTAPFALLSLLLMRESLNVYSIFGVVMLLGTLKKNGILQVDMMNQLVAAGIPARDAIVESNRVRLHPILMTTMTLIAAMAPMTMARGPGAVSRAALAKVIVGGQALSLVVTLLIVPVAWWLFDDAQR